jgi:hypothetical protein
MPALVTGDRLGDRYRIVHPISRGGMGAVYEAVDERIGRRVAVKVLLDELVGDASAMERFRREARAIALVSHPGLVALYDLSIDGSPAFLVMELVEGPSLAELLSSLGRLPWPRAALLVADVLDTLGALHRAGIVHRDLKPANVLSVGEGANERAKLIDLGVAQLATGAAYQRLTTSGAVIGTPAYMAPEQLAGEAVGPPADLFAAGVLLYTAVSGERPFSGAEFPQLLYAVHTVTPAPLSSLVPGAPAKLDAIASELLEKSPEARPRDPGAIAARLRALAEGMPFASQASEASSAGRSFAGAPVGAGNARAARTPAMVAVGRPEVATVTGERTRAIARSTRAGWIAAAFAALGIVTTCAVGIALAAVVVTWRDDGVPAVSPMPVREGSIRILYRGDEAEAVQVHVGPVLDPMLRACLPNPAGRALGETSGFLVSVGPNGVPTRVESTMMMASATSDEVACLDAAIRGVAWPVPSNPFAMSTIIITIM